MFLFHLLKESVSLCRNETLKLEETFGPCQHSLANKAHNVTQQLLSCIPDGILEKELQRSSKTNSRKEFGHKTKFYFPNTEQQTEDSQFSILDSDSEEEEKELKFSLSYDPQKWMPKDAGLSSNHIIPKEKETSNIKATGISWLKQKCDLYFRSGSENINSSDMCSVIFDLLSSPRSDQEMQNELFELLGFERFEFIQELLANREEVVVGTTKSADTINGM